MANTNGSPSLLQPMVPCLFIFGVIMPPLTTAWEEPSVNYIQTPSQDFFLAHNLTIDLSNVTRVLPGLSPCECKSTCVSLSLKCQAWSFLKATTQRKTSKCLLSDHGPQNTPLRQEQDAIYYFKKSSVPGTYNWQPDSLLYLTLDDQYFYEEAKELCSKIPGHRLIIIKSPETYRFFRKQPNQNSRPHWLTDLRKINQSYYEWGDGTPSSETAVDVIINDSVSSNLFCLYDDVLHDISHDGGPFRILCQANPLGVHW